MHVVWCVCADDSDQEPTLVIEEQTNFSAYCLFMNKTLKINVYRENHHCCLFAGGLSKNHSLSNFFFCVAVYY